MQAAMGGSHGNFGSEAACRRGALTWQRQRLPRLHMILFSPSKRLLFPSVPILPLGLAGHSVDDVAAAVRVRAVLPLRREADFLQLDL